MGFFKNSSIKNEYGKRYEDLSIKQEIKERYPNINKEDFLKDLADKNPYHHKDKPPVYEEMDDIDNWEVEEPPKDRELSKNIWDINDFVYYNPETPDDGYLDFAEEGDDDSESFDLSTPEGIIDSIDDSYQKETALNQEKRKEQKAADRKKTKDAKWRMRKLKYTADWHSKEELPVMKEAYENYYQNFLLKSAQRKGDTAEFNRLSKLDGRMEVSGKTFAGEALKEDAIDFAKIVKKENIENGNWQKMPGKLLNRLQYDNKYKCLKTFEDTLVKTKNEFGQEILNDVRIIYNASFNDRISDVYRLRKKINDFYSHGKNIKVYEIEFQPPFFEMKKDKDKKQENETADRKKTYRKMSHKKVS